MTPTPLPSFDQLFDDHDRDPALAADALQAMADGGLVAEKYHRRYAWLVNHVVGELLGQWPAALQTLDKAVASSSELPCLVQRAVASHYAGKPVAAIGLVARIAHDGDCPCAAADAAVKLAVLRFAAADEPALALAEAFNGVLGTLAGMHDHAGKLASLLAASLNNVTSRLLDAKDADIAVSAYRQALRDGAEVCRSFWRVAGNWVNHERADYLVALCANRLQDYAGARNAARVGIETITAHGSEDVDRAFLLLELARAEQALGHPEAGADARSEAVRLAAAFDADLRADFDVRAAA